jgi:hypothetical protein
MRNSSAAPENDLRRTYPAKARRRASIFITSLYIRPPFYVFFFYPGINYNFFSLSLFGWLAT